MPNADIEKVIGTGLAELGQHESPFGSNKTKYGAWYGLNGGAWCAMFVSWVFWHAGFGLPPVSTSKGFAYVEAGRQWAIKNGCYRRGTSGIKRGDVIMFSFGGVRADHVGIVLGVLPDGRIHTLEGNTDVSGGRTGGIVMEKYRRSSIDGYIPIDPLSPGVDWAAIRRFIAAVTRNAYGATPYMKPEHPNADEVKALQKALNIVTKSSLPEDGRYTQQVADQVWEFQKYMKAMGADIPEFPGTSGDHTRMWLCAFLEQIRDGVRP